MPNQEQREHLRELVSALRSRRYKQTKGYLKTDYGYCCLGIACEISNISDWKTIIDTTGEATRRKFCYERNDKYLPTSVMEYYGFGGHLTISDRVGTWQYLAKLNDDGVSFEHIADIIEYEFNLAESANIIR